MQHIILWSRKENTNHVLCASSDNAGEISIIANRVIDQGGSTIKGYINGDAVTWFIGPVALLGEIIEAATERNEFYKRDIVTIQPTQNALDIFAFKKEN